MQFLELSDNLQRHLSNGAAQMGGVLLHAVDQLIRDKRGAKTVRREGWRKGMKWGWMRIVGESE
jgi:hypothetical protein